MLEPFTYLNECYNPGGLPDFTLMPTLGKEIECQPRTLRLEAPDGWGWMVD